MTTPNWDWVFHALGWTLAGSGLLLALWALFWDRSRGRRRCPRCWYSMEGAIASDDGSLTCPECGKEIHNERRLGRTRRRWRCAALVAALVWGASVALRFNQPGRVGFMAAVPTTALALVVSDFTATDKPTRSLLERLWREPVTPWDKWLARRTEAAAMPEDWSAAVMHRTKWPVGEPVRVKIDSKLWMWSQFDWRETTMWLEGNESAKASVYHDPPQIHAESWGGLPPDWIDLPAPQLGVNRYTLVLASNAGVHRVVRRRVEIVIVGVPTIQDVIQPFAGNVMSLQGMMKWRLWRNTSDFDWGLSLDSNNFYTANYATRFEARLKQNGKVLAVATSGDWGFTTFPLSWEDPRLAGVVDFEREVFFLDGLTVEIVPDLLGALRDLDHDAYWDGGFEMPLQLVPYLGHDGSEVYPFLLQTAEIPLGQINEPVSATIWLRANAVKLTTP